ACAASFIFGSGLMIVQMLISLGVFTPSGAFLSLVFRNSLYSGVVAMVGGLIIVPVVSLLSKKPDKKLVDDMFSCYDKKVTVETTKSLGDRKGKNGVLLKKSCRRKSTGFFRGHINRLPLCCLCGIIGYRQKPKRQSSKKLGRF
ncbi:MAG: hypothetical protein ACI4SJ_06065, partial [Candidatus Avispirillum sp.]